MTRNIAPKPVTLTGADDNALVGDVFGADGTPVLLLHGGGQTRHAWRRTAEAIARAGRVAYAIDQRGHGDSAWVESGAYAFQDYARDVAALAHALTRTHGEAPIAIGASLGGISALLAEGEASLRGAKLLSAIVLVDITPRVDRSGVDRVQGFMREHARDGFASIEDAAAAVAAYLPHRPRPKSNDGLKKNLRLGPDGRWRWHWDPRFMEGRRPVEAFREATEQGMTDAARRLTIPALLVRGAASELVQPEHVREFQRLAPHAEFADVAGARHMVAGDQNDSFSAAILDFLRRLPSASVGRSL